MIARILLILLIALNAAPAIAQDSSVTGFVEHRGTQLPDVRFIDETGASVAMSSFFGKPFFLAFAYHSCPQLCGLVLGEFAQGLRGLPGKVGNDFDVVVISIDPADTPERSLAAKQRYVARYGSDGRGWHFLTGDTRTIRAVADAAGFNFVYDPIQKTFTHPAGIFYVQRQGIVGGHIEQTTFSPDELQRLVDGAGSGSSTPWNRLCGALGFGVGARTPAVLWTLRYAAVFVVVAILGVLAFYRRRRIRGAMR